MKTKQIFVAIFAFCIIAINPLFGQSIDSVLLNYKEFQPKYFDRLYFSDVYSYFDPEVDHSTPLKKSVYESSAEYKKLTDSLKVIKAGLRTPHYLEIDVPSEVEYDLKKGGIRILMSSRFNRREVQGLFNIYEPSPDQDSKFYLAFSNLTLAPDMVYPQMPDITQREEYIFIPLNKTLGLEFENSSDIKLYIMFLPTSNSKKIKVENLAYRDYDEVHYVYATVKKIVLTIDNKIVYTRNL